MQNGQCSAVGHIHTSNTHTEVDLCLWYFVNIVEKFKHTDTLCFTAKRIRNTKYSYSFQCYLPCSQVFFCLLKHFHQRIPATSNITRSPAITIPTIAPVDMLLPPFDDDGGTKSAKRRIWTTLE